MEENCYEWLIHCSHGCFKAYFYKTTDQNYNYDIAWLVENNYLERKRGLWYPSEKGQAYLDKMKERSNEK
jgi:hypothetical protein